jgi:hypothetical protein
MIYRQKNCADFLIWYFFGKLHILNYKQVFSTCGFSLGSQHQLDPPEHEDALSPTVDLGDARGSLDLGLHDQLVQVQN